MGDFFWQCAGRGLPGSARHPPGAQCNWASLLDGYDTLLGDFVQTVLKATLAGYAVGGASGFFTGILIDRTPFLQRGLLPLSALASTVPARRRGADHDHVVRLRLAVQAAVAAIMTFFPMLVNTLAGLRVSSSMERDLMHSYAAGYYRTLLAAPPPWRCRSFSTRSK